MRPDTRESILDGQGLLENWKRFLKDQANSFEPEATAATSSSPGALKCTIADLWDVEFDSAASTDDFPPQRSLTNGSFVLPLTTGWATSQKLADILEKFGISQDGRILGDDGVLENNGTPEAGPAPTSSTGLIDDVVQVLDSQLFKVKENGRNAIWLTPGQTLRSDVALTLEIDGENNSAWNAVTGIARYFNITLPETNSRLNNFNIIIQRSRLGVGTEQEGITVWQISKTFRLTFRLVLDSFTFWLTQQPTGLSFYVTQDQTQTGNLLDLAPEPIKSIGGVIDSTLLSNMKLVQLSIGKLQDQIWWRVISAFQLHNADIYLEYESLSQTFSGGLILGDLKDADDPNDPSGPGTLLLKGFYASLDTKILPTYEPGKDIDPPGGVLAPIYKQTYLGDLAEPLRSLPSSLPTAIALASIAYTIADDDNPGTLYFAAKLIQPPNVVQPEHKVPSPFTWDLLDVHLRLDGTDVKEAELSTHFTLTDPEKESDRVALLGLRFSYDSGTWTLNGSVQNLSISMLWQFFDADVKDGLLKILGKIEIETLTVKYTYESSGAATTFVFDGTVNIGKLALRMNYEHTGTGWKFEFTAGSSDGEATLQDVVNSIVDKAGDDLPSFVGGITIPAASGDDSPIMITVQRGSNLQGSTGDDDRLYFAFHLDVGEHFKLSMVQVTNADGKETKRIIRFSVNKIPLIPKVPLLDKLPQPFDELEYMWVSSEGDGWTESEVKTINGGGILNEADQLPYKPLSGSKIDGQPADGSGDVVIKPGHHFVVLNKGAVVLDHVFAASRTPAPSPSNDSPQIPPDTGPTPASAIVQTRTRSGIAQRAVASPLDATNGQPPATNSPTKGALSFTFGPLSISAIALHYREEGGSKILALTMDATFDLNPITFSLLGFGIGLDLNHITLDHLSDLGNHLSVELHGLSLSFNKPPILIAGGFEHDTGPSGEEIYKGGIGVSFPPYTFIGIGEYAVFKDYKSVFVYAKLDGPLITLGFATISGVRLGLGYNSSVRTPRLEEITSFPFVNDHSVSGTGNDPMAILSAMTTEPAWVTPTNNSYWFAAGLSLVAFDILTVTAVAMVQFKEQGLIISIIADAVAQMPPAVTDRSLMIAYVELGFICEMNMVDGYFRVEAALAPTSFLLVPACRIYGGMALVYWFHPNDHAGDWVFTVGGYHRKFQKPEWYPTVQRVGISFSVGILQVTGETYFAITPKVAMGGALIHVTLSVGPVSAWLDAGFDALVNFHPLHYQVEFHVSVGVTFDADAWFVHIHISASVGAWLEVQGPAFGGIAHVDFCMFSFDVDFGASPSALPPMTLFEFWQMLHKPGPNVQSQNTNDEDPLESLLMYDNDTADTSPAKEKREDGAAIKFALEDGNVPMPSPKGNSTSSNEGPTSTGAGSKWFVKGGSFRFRVNSDFAVSKATITDTTEVTSPTDQAIYSRPMHVDTPIVSDVTVTVTRAVDSSVQKGWKTVAADMKKMPQAAFGKYDPKLDPSDPNADTTSLLSSDPGVVSLMMGVIISAPPPILAESRIGLIQNATNMMLAGIKDYRTGGDWELPAWEPAQSKYLPTPLTDAGDAATNQELWDRMRDKWSALTAKEATVNDESDGLLAQCTDILGWQKNQLQTVVLPPSDAPPASTPASGEPAPYQPWRLTGKLPMKLINNLEVRYLELPRVAVV